MSASQVIQAGGYYIRCWGEFDQEKGQWRPVISFERVADYSKTLVPGIRHQLAAWFATEKEAARVAEEQFPRLIESGEVGL